MRLSCVCGDNGISYKFSCKCNGVYIVLFVACLLWLHHIGIVHSQVIVAPHSIAGVSFAYTETHLRIVWNGGGIFVCKFCGILVH